MLFKPNEKITIELLQEKWKFVKSASSYATLDECNELLKHLKATAELKGNQISIVKKRNFAQEKLDWLAINCNNPEKNISQDLREAYIVMAQLPAGPSPKK